jgi:low affinity Fe/Cu permease
VTAVKHAFRHANWPKSVNSAFVFFSDCAFPDGNCHLVTAVDFTLTEAPMKEKDKHDDRPLKQAFAKFASSVAYFAGSPLAFSAALTSLIAWALCGPFFDYSEAWQLVINTGTTIVTFMMVFVIQNSQNRDSMAIQIKLDELIRASGAKNSMIDLECLSEDELAELRIKFAEIANRARKDEYKVEKRMNGKHKPRKSKATAASPRPRKSKPLPRVQI